MKALKVMYRGPSPDIFVHTADIPRGFVLRGRRHDYNALYSAIPTPQAVRYYAGEETIPEMGKLMVYLTRMEELAEQFCRTAAGWYRRCNPATNGTVEIWRVECHNLYRLDYLIEPRRVMYDGITASQVRRFWRIVQQGLDPRFREVGAKKSIFPLWTTDSIIPEEQLAVYAIRSCHWRRKLEGQR